MQKTMKMSNLMVLMSGVFLLACGCRGSALERQKSEAKQKFGAESPGLLRAASVGNFKLEAREVPLSDLQVEGAIISLPVPLKAVEGKSSVKLFFDGFEVFVYHAKAGKYFDALPSKWGKNDLDKMIALAKTSGATLDAATSKVELEDAILKITSKAVVCPPGVELHADLVEADSYFGFLSGGGEVGKRIALYLRPKDAIDVCYRVEVRPTEKDFDEGDLRAFLSAIRIKLSRGPGE